MKDEIKQSIICVKGRLFRDTITSDEGIKYKVAGYFTPKSINGFFELHKTNTDWYILNRKVVL